MEVLKTLVPVFVAVISSFGATYFTYKQFLLKRQDEKEEKEVNKIIIEAVKQAKDEMRKEIEESVQRSITSCGEIGEKSIAKTKEELKKEMVAGLEERERTGKERFDINSRQIEQNTKQIGELTELVKDLVVKIDVQTESMKSVSQVCTASAKSQRNSNYDRILMVTNKVLKSGKITVTEKTNLRQLYNSWKELHGEDDKIETLYDECMKFTPIPDEGVI